MKRSKVSISLPGPCGENWDSMTPKGNGRHCAQCCKTVVDFTLLSDGEILDIFKKAKTNPPCGHFLETQLDRELIDTRYRPLFISKIVKRAAAMLILFQSVSVAALAQHVKKGVSVHHADGSKVPAKKSGRQICGHVFRYPNEEPLRDVRVQIVGTQIAGLTDKYGMFILDLPDSFYMADIPLEGSIAGNTGTDFVIEGSMSLDDMLNNKELKLFAYKVLTLPVHNNIVRPDLNNIRTYSGLPVRYVEPIRKNPNIWQRMTRLFRNKKHS